MSKQTARKSTDVSGDCLTAEQAKRWVQGQGMTLKQFATRHQLPYRTVSEVIRGVNKGLYGQGHKAAVALRMK